MKYRYAILLITLLVWGACQNQKENTAHEHGTDAATTDAPDTVKKSIPKEAHAQINGTHFTINYHAPAVRSRTIWGGLVPYNEVWVTGAHSATSLEIDHDVTINGTLLAAGKYAFFTIPGQDKWIIIINRKWDQHLADEYNAKEDVVRVEVTPEILPSVQERLQYAIVDKGNAEASIEVRWEKIKVSLPVKL